jgi:trk system potassium uptake protein TrkH
MVLGRKLWELTPRDYRRGGLAAIPATRLFLLSFGILIGIGTLGLLVLPGLYTGPRLGFVDALFTATSAVCVTGLIVVDTATYFTPLGQAWIAILIQLGGLGILTFTTLLIVLLGKRATLGIEEAAGGHASVFPHLGAVSLVKAIVVATFVVEAAGAAVLWLTWTDDLGARAALWPAVFHAVSAFSNAGFTILPDSLVGFRRSPLTVLTISALIVTGGIGFIVLADLRARYLLHRTHRLGTHTRLVLATTGILLVGGMILFVFFEAGGELAPLGWLDRPLNAFFMSVTARTAGFNTIDYNAVSNATLFLTMSLMLVGGSPGSTAGGLKTTTLALLFLALWARLRGRNVVSAWGRTVREGTVQRAAGVAMGGIAVLALGILLLAVSELSGGSAADRAEFLRLIFEAHSAFGTVGLSMGVTSDLTTAGRLIIIFLMFVGRVGPLAAASAMAFAEFRTKVKYRYPYEDVVIG